MTFRITTKKILISAWFLLLPAGVIALTLIRPFSLLPFDDRGFGKFQASIHGSISDEDRDLQARFEGRSHPEWRWSAPEKYRYTDVLLQWKGQRSNGKGVLHLPTMTLDQGNEAETIDSDWFNRLTRNRPLADQCVEVLEDARDGNLPVPGSSPIEYNRGSIRRSLEHRFEGLFIPYSASIWMIVWMAFSALFFRRFHENTTTISPS